MRCTAESVQNNNQMQYEKVRANKNQKRNGKNLSTV